MSEPINQPTVPGDHASGVQGGDEAVASKQPASNPTAAERVRAYAATYFRSNGPRMDGSTNLAATQGVSLTHARIVAEAHAAAAVEPWKARVAELEALKTTLDGLVDISADYDNRTADRIAELERERDEAQARCREAAQTLIAAIGAAGPENVEDTARRAAQRMAELEDALRGLASRYHRDAHEGDGIPEDAHEWDTAQRVLLGKEAQT